MDPDRELVERALVGDIGAFEELVKRHREVVFRVAARVVGQADAEDVSQDAFLRAFHRLERFRGEGSFRSWLLQITHNAALNSVNKTRSDPATSQVEQPEPVAVAVTAEREPVSRLEQRERRERLTVKLGQLRPEPRAVLVLRDIEGLSYEEVADVTESPLGSVKGRLHRARRELIEILRRNTYDWELPSDEP